MTDNEIIKALECCMHSKSRIECEKLQCPACKKQGCYFNNISEEDYPEGLIEGISISLLDLINRQKAEIERLKHEYSNAILTIKSKDSFIEYLKEYAKERKIEEIENRGIKKFWKRLKSQNTMDRRIISVKSGDNLVKEMTEGNQ